MLSIIFISSIQYKQTCKVENQARVDIFNAISDSTTLQLFIEQIGILKIPCGVTTINQQINTFKNKNDIIQIDLPDSVQIIKNTAFYQCVNLKYVNIPNSVTEIGNNAFQQCKRLVEIKLPNTIQSIKNGTFSECYNLQEIIIPESVQTIDSYAFQQCYSLKHVQLSHNITQIQSYTFSNCSSLNNVIIPPSIININQYGFLGCNSLQCIVFMNNSTTYANSQIAAQQIIKSEYGYCNDKFQYECNKKIKYRLDNQNCIKKEDVELYYKNTNDKKLYIIGDCNSEYKYRVYSNPQQCVQKCKGLTKIQTDNTVQYCEDNIGLQVGIGIAVSVVILIIIIVPIVVCCCCKKDTKTYKKEPEKLDIKYDVKQYIDKNQYALTTTKYTF